MDGAFFVSRSELLSWANSTFKLTLGKVEQCSNGAVYCQVIDACHNGTVTMKKVNWAARVDHEAIPNYKVLQQAFDRCGIQKHVEVDKLVRGKYQDNLEMLQWIKTYFDRTFQGNEYDPVSRRFTENLPEWARPSDGGLGGGMPARQPSESGRPASSQARQPENRRASTGSSSGYGVGLGRSNSGDANAAAIAAAAGAANEEALREEVVDLKITVDGLETERDFYFQKLRDIEILCQTLEANPDPHMTTMKFVEDVQKMLYARDDAEDAPA